MQWDYLASYKEPAAIDGVPESSICVLPPNVSALAGACTADQQVRFRATTGIHVTLTHDTYQAVATDGRILARIKGSREVITTWDGMKLNSPPETVAVIPAELLKGDGVNMTLGIGEKDSCIVVGNHDNFSVRRFLNVEGRYPDFDKVIPNSTPNASMIVDAGRLCRLAKIAKDMEPGVRIILEIRKENEVDYGSLVMRADLSSEQSFYGILIGCAKTN